MPFIIVYVCDQATMLLKESHFTLRHISLDKIPTNIYIFFQNFFYSSSSNVYCCAWMLPRAEQPDRPQRSTSETEVATPEVLKILAANWPPVIGLESTGIFGNGAV